MINSKMGWSAALLALLVIMDVLVSNAGAACALCKNAENWDLTANSFLTGNTTEQTLPSNANPQMSRANNWGLKDNSTEKTSPSLSTPQLSRANDLNANSAAPQRSSSYQEMLAPVSSVMPATRASSTNPSSYDVILDVSPEANEYIQGAISIPYDKFLSNGSMKPVSEVAKILGDAGISQQNSVLVYGRCLPCGANVLTAPYVYWILNYMGQDKVKMLDGNIDDWVAAKLPTETVPKVLQKTNYTPVLRPELLATYDYVKNGQEQIVDARTFQEYGMGYIPKALNIPYDQVLNNGYIKDEAELKDLFGSLSKDKPVVVYTDTGTKASIVWFALKALGYNAALYSWQDWMANQPKLNVELEDIRADPNPATPGSPVKITALFGEVKKNANVGSTMASNATNQTILTTKGCATCGFGSPQGFANINKSSGVAQLGNSGPKTASQAGGFTSAATVKDSSGSDVGSVSMKRIAGDEYSGIWNANVGQGIYKVTLVVSASGITKTFDNVLDIKVVGAEKDTSKFKKVGN